MNPDTPGSLPPSSPSTTYPSRMLASCAAGHLWPVEMFWQSVSGLEADTRIRVPWADPRECPTCGAPFLSLRFIDDNVRPELAPALVQERSQQVN